MRVVIAIDSFKGSMSSRTAAEAAMAGVLDAYPAADCDICPVADGGEGTVDALMAAVGAEQYECTVSDPIGRKITASYGYSSATRTAVIEMSAAAGITLVSGEERNPLYTTTYGVGEMLCDALSRGARRFIIGIGGSATNDGGAGMLEALGYRFLDKNGIPVRRGGIGLIDIYSIDESLAIKELSGCEIVVASDVSNPLCGELGASYVYGGQKGADEKMKELLDLGLMNFAECTRALFPSANPNSPGAGAAGGLGFALREYLSASMRPGIELVSELAGLDGRIGKADIVITGEGRLDGQSCMGKVPAGVAALALKHGIPCLAFAGAVSSDAIKLHELGLTAFFPIARGPVSLAEAMNEINAKENMRSAVREVFLLIRAQKEVK